MSDAEQVRACSGDKGTEDSENSENGENDGAVDDD